MFRHRFFCGTCVGSVSSIRDFPVRICMSVSVTTTLAVDIENACNLTYSRDKAGRVLDIQRFEEVGIRLRA